MRKKEHDSLSSRVPSGPSFLGTWSKRVNAWCEMGLFATLTAMIVVTCLQIVFRIWFKALTWSEELTCFLLVAASFLGTAVAFERGSHIAVTFLIDLLPKSLKRYCMLAVLAVGGLFFAVVSWYGVVLCLQERGQTATAIAVSMSWIYLIFPVSGITVILHLIAQAEAILKEGA